MCEVNQDASTKLISEIVANSTDDVTRETAHNAMNESRTERPKTCAGKTFIGQNTHSSKLVGDHLSCLDMEKRASVSRWLFANEPADNVDWKKRGDTERPLGHKVQRLWSAAQQCTTQSNESGLLSDNRYATLT
jgi:hypothetical protein